ncbi:PREDICTED: CMRF35-like molecule 1 [Charadrius vociferus]|uniref:CMRF35-like molecule 1 n=1 Tax=Charadrius vociferus TaxID=50402 RepID=UPI0005212745|nr:PREDICTED: CMRF35-like molecule 1 [Charadrius vociferus]
MQEVPVQRQHVGGSVCLLRLLGGDGHRTVRGFLGGSLLMNCKYWHGDEMKPTFWCKLGTDSDCAADIVITSKNQSMVWRERFSIRDNHAGKLFMVTTEGLAEGDMGTYLCKVQRSTTQREESYGVKVMVSTNTSAAMR